MDYCICGHPAVARRPDNHQAETRRRIKSLQSRRVDLAVEIARLLREEQDLRDELARHVVAGSRPCPI